MESQWRISRSWDGSVTFYTSWTELNVAEEPLYPGEGAPGTYDKIILRLTSRTPTYFEDGVEVSGECHFWKNGEYKGSFQATVTVHKTDYENQIVLVVVDWTPDMSYFGAIWKQYGSLLP